jgi:hypothetical protein
LTRTKLAAEDFKKRGERALEFELRVFLKSRQNCGEQAGYTDRWMREHMTKKQTFLEKYCVFSVQFVPSVRSIVHAYMYGPVLYTLF